MKTIDGSGLKEVVYGHINFELPYDVWRKIEGMFWAYWERVGFGNVIDFDRAVEVVEKYLKLMELSYEHYKVVRIIEIIFGYLEAEGATTFIPNETEGIDDEEMRKAVYDQIDFKLSSEAWQEINDVFTEYWGQETKQEYFIDWNIFTDLVAGRLKKKHILLDREKIDCIVEAIIEHLKETGEISPTQNEGRKMGPRQLKSKVYNRIDFELPDKAWWEIYSAFIVYWDKAIGTGEPIDWTAITSYIAGHLKRKRILLDLKKIIRIVDIIHEYVIAEFSPSDDSDDSYEPTIKFFGNRYNADRIELYDAEEGDSSTVIWASIKGNRLSLHKEDARDGGKGYVIKNIVLSKLFQTLHIKAENDLVLLLRQEYKRSDGVERMVEFLEKHDIAYDREDK